MKQKFNICTINVRTIKLSCMSLILSKARSGKCKKVNIPNNWSYNVSKIIDSIEIVVWEFCVSNVGMNVVYVIKEESCLVTEHK